MKVTMLHVGTNTLFNISCKFIIVYYFTDLPADFAVYGTRLYTFVRLCVLSKC